MFCNNNKVFAVTQFNASLLTNNTIKKIAQYRTVAYITIEQMCMKSLFCAFRSLVSPWSELQAEVPAASQQSFG